MIVVVLVLAVALLVAAGFLALTDRARRRAVSAIRRMRSERDERVQRAESERDGAVAAQLAAEAARARAESELEAAVPRAEPAERAVDAATPPPGSTPAPLPERSGPDGALDALWALTRLQAAWARRRAGELSTAAPATDEPDPLTEVLAIEVETVRDDAGIPGSLRVAVTPSASPAEAVVVASATTALLRSLARWCDAYDLFVHRWEGRITAIIVCEGFSGPDSVADETSELLSAVAPAGGDLDVDRDAAGRLRARLSLPAPDPPGC